MVQDLDLTAPSISGSLAADDSVLDAHGATHFVAGITWGVQCLIQASCAPELLSLVRPAKDPIADEFRQPRSGYPNPKTSLSMYSDFRCREARGSFEEHRQYMRDTLPSEIARRNRGKGVRIAYKLLPLATLSSVQDIEVLGYPEVLPIDPEKTKRFINWFDKIRDFEAMMVDYNKACGDRYRVLPQSEQVQLNG